LAASLIIVVTGLVSSKAFKEGRKRPALSIPAEAIKFLREVGLFESFINVVVYWLSIGLAVVKSIDRTRTHVQSKSRHCGDCTFNNMKNLPNRSGVLDRVGYVEGCLKKSARSTVSPPDLAEKHQ
jgi:uncharacterized protein YjeT (DUF2065 family)